MRRANIRRAKMRRAKMRQADVRRGIGIQPINPSSEVPSSEVSSRVGESAALTTFQVSRSNYLEPICRLILLNIDIFISSRDSRALIVNQSAEKD